MPGHNGDEACDNAGMANPVMLWHIFPSISRADRDVTAT